MSIYKVNKNYTAINELEEICNARGWHVEKERLYDGYILKLFKNHQRIADVVQHFFSYGQDKNLLEMMDEKTEEVTGYLTIKNVLNIWEKMLDK